MYAPTCYSELSDLLLIAGGVGINPLFSMLQHHVHLLHSSGQRSNVSVLNHKGRVQLLYSAWSRDELIFKVRVWNPTFFFSTLLEQSVCVYVTVTRFYSLS